MQAAEHSHYFVVDSSLQMTSTVVEVSQCHSPSWSPSTNFMQWTLTRCCTVAIHRRWYRTLWASTILAVGSSTDVFVASHWLERSYSRFSVTLLIFNRADHSTLQVLTIFYVGFISTQLILLHWRPPTAVYIMSSNDSVSEHWIMTQKSANLTEEGVGNTPQVSNIEVLWTGDVVDKLIELLSTNTDIL